MSTKQWPCVAGMRTTAEVDNCGVGGRALDTWNFGTFAEAEL